MLDKHLNASTPSRASRGRLRSSHGDKNSFNDRRSALSMVTLTGRSSTQNEGAVVMRNGQIVSRITLKNARFVGLNSPSDKSYSMDITKGMPSENLLISAEKSPRNLEHRTIEDEKT